MGEFWVGQVTKTVNQGYFNGIFGAEPIRFSHGQFRLVVESLDGSRGNLTFDAIQEADPPRPAEQTLDGPVSLSKPAIVLLCLKKPWGVRGAKSPALPQNHPRISPKTLFFCTAAS